MTPEDIETLRKLKDLFDEGVITEANFELQKQRLLAKETVEASSNVSKVFINRLISGELASNRRRRVLLICVTSLSLVALLVFLFRGGESFNQEAVDDEILFLYPDLGPNSRKEYREFVESACQWDQADETAFAEDRVSEFSDSEFAALGFFRSLDGLEDFQRLVSIGCGTFRSDEISETLTRGSGVFLPKEFVTKDSFLFYEECSREDNCPDSFDSYLPVDDLNLLYGDFRPDHRIFAAWFRTVFAEVEGPSASDSILRPDSLFKFWKRVIVDDQYEYFFCVQRNEVCASNGFLRLYWEDRAWVFVGLGSISEVEGDAGIPGKILIEPVQGGTWYGEKGFCSKVEGLRPCYWFDAIALITSSQDDQAFLLNVKSNFGSPRESVVSLDEMFLSDGSKNYKLLPCRLDVDGGQFIRDAEMVFRDQTPAAGDFYPGFITRDYMFGDEYSTVSSFVQEINILMCLEKGARPPFRSKALWISAPKLAETKTNIQWLGTPAPEVDLRLPYQDP